MSLRALESTAPLQTAIHDFLMALHKLAFAEWLNDFLEQAKTAKHNLHINKIGLQVHEHTSLLTRGNDGSAHPQTKK